MTLAIGVVALAVPLRKQRRELVGEPLRALTAAGLGQPVLCSGGVVNDFPTRPEILEGFHHVGIG